MKKSTKTKLSLALFSVLLTIVLVAVNLLAGLIPWKISAASFASDPVFALSSATKTQLNTLGEDVTLYLLCEDGRINVDRDLYAFLKSYEALSNHISVEVIDTESETEFLTSHDIGEISEGAICFVVESARRHMLLSLSDLYYYYYSDGETEFYLNPAEYAASAERLSTMGYNMTPYFNGEAGITNAIRFVSLEKVPKIAIVQAAYQTSNGEIVPLNAQLPDPILQSLRQYACDIDFILNVSELTEEHELLILNSPILDLTATETTALRAWLSAGGNMILSTYFNTREQPRLASILAEYGLSADEKNIRIKEESVAHASGNYHSAMMGSHEITKPLLDLVVISDAHAIHLDESQKDVKLTRLLYTTTLGSREKYDSETGKWSAIEEDPSSLTLGAVAERGESRVLWVSTPYLFDLADPFSSDANHSFLLSAIDWMSESSLQTVETSANAMNADVLLVSTTAFAIWLVILVILLPLSLLLVGFFRRYMRKRR